MSTTYDSIYDRFLGSITDYELAALVDATLETNLFKYLKGAITDFKFSTKDLSNRNESTKVFNVDLTETEQEILAKYMLVRWINPNVNRLENLRPSFGSKDITAFSGANFLDKLVNAKKALLNEADSDMVFYYHST